MKTLTIPKKFVAEDELVVLPRRDYEQLVSDSSKETVKHDPRIDRELAISMAEFKRGEIEGPFNTVKEFMKSLYRKPKHSRKTK